MSAQRELAELVASIERCDKIFGSTRKVRASSKQTQFLRTHGPALADLIEDAQYALRSLT